MTDEEEKRMRKGDNDRGQQKTRFIAPWQFLWDTRKVVQPQRKKTCHFSLSFSIVPNQLAEIRTKAPNVIHTKFAVSPV